MRVWRRKTSSTSTASTAPMIIASRTDDTASRTSSAWSYIGVRRTPGGSVRRTEAAMAAMLSASTTVLLPIWRVMFSRAAGRPSPATMRTWSSVPICTVARSRTRRPWPTMMLAMSLAARASDVVTMRYCR